MSKLEKQKAKSKLTSISATTETKNEVKQLSAILNKPVYVVIGEMVKERLNKLQK
jgi:hypothetical protein